MLTSTLLFTQLFIQGCFGGGQKEGAASPAPPTASHQTVAGQVPSQGPPKRPSPPCHNTDAEASNKQLVKKDVSVQHVPATVMPDVPHGNTPETSFDARSQVDQVEQLVRSLVEECSSLGGGISAGKSMPCMLLIERLCDDIARCHHGCCAVVEMWSMMYCHGDMQACMHTHDRCQTVRASSVPDAGTSQSTCSMARMHRRRRARCVPTCTRSCAWTVNPCSTCGACDHGAIASPARTFVIRPAG